MNPNRRRLPVAVALLWEHGPPHITARFLETEQSTRQCACSGTIEQAAPRFIPRGHRAEYRLSVGQHR